MKLTGKAALVTGGGTGMGRAITLKFAAEGANVTINYSRRAKEAEETIEAARQLGVRAFAMKADVSVEAEAIHLVEETVKQFGRLDVLVNNAGWSTVVPHRKLEGLTEEILERTWRTNVKGPIYVTRAAIPHMLKAGGGSIVNTTSVAAFQGAGSSIIYGASKAALGAITKSLARAFGKDNIRVSAIAPGFVDTGFVDWPTGAKEKAVAGSPMGRIPTVDDAANAV
ncbi:MAG: putative dehydrogenase like protein, partial [candidate division NC10 bacterium]|nr:putative dehydrogenase like protein [candidate division NC10 bacterium]